MMIEDMNYSWGRRPLPKVENGTEFKRVNFTQKVPHTKIFVGMTGLKFVKCNLTNCDIPGDAEVTQCLRNHVSFCGHVHENWVEKGILDACDADCIHVVDTDELIVDGVSLGAIKHYSDKAVK